MSGNSSFRLSPAALAHVREIIPQGELVAIYDGNDLTRPLTLLPPSRGIGALETAWDLGNAYVVSIDDHGRLSGMESGPANGVPIAESFDLMIEKARGLHADGIAVVAAVAEYLDWRTRLEDALDEGLWYPEGEEWPQMAELRRLYAEACLREGVRT